MRAFKTFKKIVRTAQNTLLTRESKETIQRYIHTVIRKPYDADFCALKHFPESPLLLDIGANYGQSIFSMKLFRPKAQIISYEPNPLVAEYTRSVFQSDPGAAGPQVVVKCVGLGDVKGEFDLHVPRYGKMIYPGLASFDRHEAANWLPNNLYWFQPSKQTIEQVKCFVETLDAQVLPDAPFFLKIDVQGFEAQVLRGGINLLTQHRPVLMLENAWANREIHEMLIPLDYVEYSYDSGVFTRIPEKSTGYLNSFFIPESKLAALSGAEVRQHSLA